MGLDSEKLMNAFADIGPEDFAMTKEEKEIFNKYVAHHEPSDWIDWFWGKSPGGKPIQYYLSGGRFF